MTSVRFIERLAHVTIRASQMIQSFEKHLGKTIMLAHRDVRRRACVDDDSINGAVIQLQRVAPVESPVEVDAHMVKASLAEHQ